MEWNKNQCANKADVDSPTVCNCTINNSIYFLNLSPINAKLTSLSYVHQYIFVYSATSTVTTVMVKTLLCFSVTLPINRQISLFLLQFHFASNFKIVSHNYAV